MPTRLKRSLDSLTIVGFKSIRELRDFPLTQRNILIGANGAGKSNFVEFFRLLRAMFQENLQNFVQQAGGGDGLFFEGDEASDVAGAIARLVAERPGVVSPVRATAPAQVTVHEDGGVPVAVWLMLADGRARRIQIEGLELSGKALRDAIYGHVHVAVRGTFSIEMAPGSTRLFEVIDAPALSASDGEEDA